MPWATCVCSTPISALSAPHKHASRRARFDVSEMLGSNPHAKCRISPDGKTFAMVRRTPATRIMVVQNLPELVRRLSAGAGQAR